MRYPEKIDAGFERVQFLKNMEEYSEDQKKKVILAVSEKASPLDSSYLTYAKFKSIFINIR